MFRQEFVMSGGGVAPDFSLSWEIEFVLCEGNLWRKKYWFFSDEFVSRSSLYKLLGVMWCAQ